MRLYHTSLKSWETTHPLYNGPDKERAKDIDTLVEEYVEREVRNNPRLPEEWFREFVYGIVAGDENGHFRLEKWEDGICVSTKLLSRRDEKPKWTKIHQ